VSIGATLRLEAATRRWARLTALDAVDLRVTAGERVALIGPSGSGKSTMLNLFAGSLATSSGAVVIDGQSLASLSRKALRGHRARCGIIPQSTGLVLQLTVHRNVIAGLLPRWPWYRSLLATMLPLEQERVRQGLARVGLADKQYELAANLSGGERQRVAVVRALIDKPSLIVADEPSASLDPSNAAQVVKLLTDGQATVVVSTHRVSLFRDHVDRLVGLRAGRIVLDTSPADLSEQQLDDLYRGSDELR
jgi:phosphonate transport system ATP-binding protein